jgi:hypothetical protein
MGNQHPKTHSPTDKDLRQNPGIGTSKATIKGLEEDENLDGENTFKGDTDNDVTPQGGVDPNHTGRTNK